MNLNERSRCNSDFGQATVLMDDSHITVRNNHSDEDAYQQGIFFTSKWGIFVRRVPSCATILRLEGSPTQL